MSMQTLTVALVAILAGAVTFCAASLALELSSGSVRVVSTSDGAVRTVTTSEIIRWTLIEVGAPAVIGCSILTVVLLPVSVARTERSTRPVALLELLVCGAFFGALLPFTLFLAFGGWGPPYLVESTVAGVAAGGTLALQAGRRSSSAGI